MRYKGDVRMVYIVHTLSYAMSNIFKIFGVCRFFKLLQIPVVTSCCCLAKIDFSRGLVVPCWWYVVKNVASMKCCVKQPANKGWCRLLLMRLLLLFLLLLLSLSFRYLIGLPLLISFVVHRYIKRASFIESSLRKEYFLLKTQKIMLYQVNLSTFNHYGKITFITKYK